MAGYTDTFNDGLDSYSLNAGSITVAVDWHRNVRLMPITVIVVRLANLSANIASLQSDIRLSASVLPVGQQLPEKVRRYMQGNSPVEHVFLLTRMVEAYWLMAGRWRWQTRWGTGVVTDISSYYRNITSADLKRLPDDVEATCLLWNRRWQKVAIGYRKFSVLKGNVCLHTASLVDGSQPRLASEIQWKGRELAWWPMKALPAEWRVTPGKPCR